MILQSSERHERVPELWDIVSAENSGRGWSARFHSCLLQGLELTGAMVHCNASHGVDLGFLKRGRLRREGAIRSHGHGCQGEA